MTITMKDVRNLLDPDEVDYSKAKQLGSKALPFLSELAQGGDLGLASKAVYLASLISGVKAKAILEKAAVSNEPVIRAAAAAGIRNLSETNAKKITGQLGNDPDVGIRKVVLKSISNFKSPALLNWAREMAEKDSEPFIRELAGSTVEKIKLNRKK